MAEPLLCAPHPRAAGWQRRRVGGERGQTTAEWVGLVLVVAVLLVAISAATGARIPGGELARSIAARLICAAGIGEDECDTLPSVDPRLVRAYGPDVAFEAAGRVPTLAYEEGMRALPVDFRTCRSDPCSMGGDAGEVTASVTGEPVTLFVHAIDCRPGGDAIERGYDCDGRRAGNLYLQYWAYYPGSQSWPILRGVAGNPGHHPDDWESYQLRTGGGQTVSRASSHHGYNHGGGASAWPSDAGWTSRAGWGPARGQYRVSGGSHAGHIDEQRDQLRRQARKPRTGWHPALRDLRRIRFSPRWTPRERVRLIPIEPIARRGGDRYRFAVTPPWDKRVYRDPEYRGTD
jgi:hypothetical protein